MRTLAMPKTAEPWSLTSLREKLIKIGAKVVSHGRYVTINPTFPGFATAGRNCLPHRGAPQRNSIAADPRTAKWRDTRPRNAGTRRFSVIKAHLCRRRLSHLTRSPGHAGAGAPRNRAMRH